MSDDKKNFSTGAQKNWAKILQFRKKEAAPDAEAVRMLLVADDIDAVILRHLNEHQMDPRDVAGLLAHRLGTLMRHIEPEDRKLLWQIVRKVLRAQAELEKVGAE